MTIAPMLPGFDHLVEPFHFPDTPHEFRITPLRDCPLPDALQHCDTPEKAAEYWRLHIARNPHYNPEVECFAVLLLNTRRRVKGHQIVSVGTQDAVLVHPREVFRLAVMTSAHAIIVAHNHPSGESSPSDADLRTTRDLIRAGQLLKVELLDHVVVLSKRLDNMIYAECRIMPSWWPPSVQFRVKPGGHLIGTWDNY